MNLDMAQKILRELSPEKLEKSSYSDNLGRKITFYTGREGDLKLIIHQAKYSFLPGDYTFAVYEDERLIEYSKSFFKGRDIFHHAQEKYRTFFNK